jgi:hypothetical protein
MKIIPITPANPISRYVKYPSRKHSSGPFQRSCKKHSAMSNLLKSFDSKFITLPCSPSTCDDFVIRRIYEKILLDLFVCVQSYELEKKQLLSSSKLSSYLIINKSRRSNSYFHSDFKNVINKRMECQHGNQRTNDDSRGIKVSIAL